MPRGGYRPGAGAKPLPPGEKACVISVTLRPATLRRLDAAAEASGRSRSAILNELISRHLPLSRGQKD
jgi:predicted transcriptional regulator